MLLCKQCEKQVSYFAIDICQQCQIGDENPAIWAVKKIKSGLTDDNLWGNKIEQKRQAYENLHYRIDTGEYCNDVPKSDIKKKLVSISILAHCDCKPDDKSPGNIYYNIFFHIRCWTDGGETSFGYRGPYKITDMSSFEGEVLPVFNEILVDLIKFAKSGKVFCSGCYKEIEPKEIGGRRYVGCYCKPCWEKYKSRSLEFIMSFNH